MKLVIEMPERKWKVIQEGMYCGLLDRELYQAIKNGTPLEEVLSDIRAKIRAISDSIPDRRTQMQKDKEAIRAGIEKAKKRSDIIQYSEEEAEERFRQKLERGYFKG